MLYLYTGTLHTPVMSDKKVRLLCLHGYRQSDTTFREKIGSFRKGLRKLIDPVFISAPHKIGDEDPPQFGWWFSSLDKTYRASEESDVDTGFSESIDVVRETLQRRGPFDGVLAFSQGASLLSVICSMHDKEPEKFPFKFAIFISGFKSRSRRHAHFYDSLISCPSLHVYGDTDAVIPKKWSEELAKGFVTAQTHCHVGGHYLPATASDRSVYSTFISQFIS
ncbi:esterase OVCA2-like [Oscarella lobularis]|uniref:esterase OVCA2-like n=1 Tax=Oscarella lobularis TaxID=121494 RepID=UPI0033143C2B